MTLGIYSIKVNVKRYFDNFFQKKSLQNNTNHDLLQTVQKTMIWYNYVMPYPCSIPPAHGLERWTIGVATALWLLLQRVPRTLQCQWVGSERTLVELHQHVTKTLLQGFQSLVQHCKTCKKYQKNLVTKIEQEAFRERRHLYIFDLDLTSRSRKLNSLYFACCIISWYQIWCLWV